MLTSENMMDNKLQNEINILASLKNAFIIELKDTFIELKDKSVPTSCILTQFCEVKEFFNKIFILNNLKIIS